MEENKYDAFVGYGIEDKEPILPILEDMDIYPSELEELGFEIKEIRGVERYVRHSFKDMFNMYSSPIDGDKALNVFAMWQVDPMSLKEVELMVKAIKNVERRFANKTEEE